MRSKSIYESAAVPSETAANTAIHLSVVDEPAVPEERISEHEDIARLAYSYWQERGCPEGSPQQDWFLAEQAFQIRKLAKQVDRETNTLGLSQTMAKSA